MALEAGDRLMGRYRILELIGSGGSSSVSLALEEATQRKVVIKELRADAPELLDAFRAEFVLLARTTHPHLTRVFDFGSELVRGGLAHYYVAEHVDGSTLSAHARTARGQELLSPYLDALEGLLELHALGIRHGDFKPSNVLVSAAGHGVLIDLGCARPFGPSASLCGTEGYLAPELLRSEGGDARSDLYSAGATLRELFAISGDEPSPKIRKLIQRLTADPPGERPSNLAEVLEQFGRAAPNLPVVPARGTLVGRESQLRAFDAWLEAFLRSQPSAPVFCVTGERGMGVSRLTHALVARGSLRARVLRARSDETHALRRLFAVASESDATEPLDAVGIARALEQVREPTLLVLEDYELLPDAERELLISLSRLIENESRFRIVLSGRTSFPAERAESVVVGPLDRSALRSLVGRLFSEQQLEALVQRTHGRPKDVERALDEHRQTSRRPARAAPGETTPRSAVRELSQEERALLGLLLVWEGELDPVSLELRFEDFSGLLAKTIAEREGTRLRLSDRFSEDALRGSLAPRELERAHEQAAEHWLREPLTPITLVRSARHLFLAGKIERAETLLGADHDWSRAGARELSKLSAAARRGRNPTLLGRLAEVVSTSGVPREGLRLAALASRRLRTTSVTLSIGERRELALRALLAAAEALTRLGRGPRAERLLVASQARDFSNQERSRLLDRLARARLQRGDYSGAEQAAREGLSADVPQLVEGHLRETLGIALGYSGRAPEGELELQTALVRLGEQASPRERARIMSHRAILAFRAGRIEQAISEHRGALALAEKDGATDLAAVACLNLGTAEQQSGQLGAALESYERGTIFARVTGRESTELTLRYNLANLYAELGSFERAEELLDRLERRAGSARFEYFKTPIAILRAELELYQERPDQAVARLDACISELERAGRSRELAEAELRRADADLALGNRASVRTRLDALKPRLSELGAVDLELGLELCLARLEIAERDPAARQRLERALERARREGLKLLEANLESELFSWFELEGDAARASEQRARARRVWDRLGSGLPPALSDVFWRHPRRAPLGELTRAFTVKGPTSRDSAALTRLLSLNRRINSSLAVTRVLESALESAIELTGAERGFVLLARHAELEEHVARASGEPRVVFFEDDEAAYASGHGPSRTVVRRVLEREEPVLTTDAEVDARFAPGSSIHALRLKSVLAVPISSPNGALGALYVDSRIQRARFSAEERDLLLAFADQVAIALGNARLHAELEQRTRELEEQKRAVERLSRGQAREIERLQREVALRQRSLESSYDYSQIAGRGPAMRELLERVDRVVESAANVLVQGESGTGKELVARAIHFNGPRKERPFVGINCAALPESLLESELFGHVRGAFTGADRDRQGLMPAANSGTLFLDEVGELPLPTQAKLLRVLQEREVRPLGSTKSQKLDIRLICATHRDLGEEVAEGRFREDLYYRIAVVSLRVPPLRERVEDLPEIASAILTRLARDASRPAATLAPDALRALAAHPFPGNVRELENVLTRAFVLSASERLLASDLDLGQARVRTGRSRNRGEFEGEERERILRSLESSRWNVSVVARTLGIPRNTLYRKLARYGLERKAT
jgi:transcriptional regulator with GAF, ATPase, and Fis domain/serine/threonine protein kinase